jgi:hypothetical protein
VSLVWRVTGDIGDFAMVPQARCWTEKPRNGWVIWEFAMTEDTYS